MNVRCMAAVTALALASGTLALGGGEAAPYWAEVRPGEVRLLRGGQVVRAYPVPQGYSAQALVTADRLALTTEPEQRWDGFQLRVYDVATGRLFARRTQVGRVSRLYSKGNALFVEYSSAVAQIATRTLAQNLRSAQERTDIDGWRVAENTRSLLFNSPRAFDRITLCKDEWGRGGTAWTCGNASWRRR